MKYLDLTGLQKLWTKIKTLVDGKVDKVSGKGLSTNDYTTADMTKLSYTNVAYGTCETAAATAAKVITISGNSNWSLTSGSMIVVKFTKTNTSTAPTFNVNNTGAKSIYYNTTKVASSSYAKYAGTADRYCIYIYNGTDYVFIGWAYDANSTYSNASLGQGYATCTTAEATTAKVGTLSSYALTTGGVVAVKFTNAVPASSTLNVNSKGAKAIYYKGEPITDGVIKAGDTATFIYNGTYYHLISIDTVASGSGGDSSVIDLGTQATHKDAQQAIVDYLIETDSKTGAYLFKYLCECYGNACFAIVHFYNDGDYSASATIYDNLHQFREFNFISGYEHGYTFDGCWKEIDSAMDDVTYGELKALRDNGDLIKGRFYRIGDYVCTTTQENTRAVDNRFDIIVQALTNSELSEIAKVGYYGDNYFANANLSAWEIKYCLDNDTTRFAWADEENGKGVIYYMKDEHGNECPYDFKNIQFKRPVDTRDGYPQYNEQEGEEKWVYTFCGTSYHIDNDEWSDLKDGSLESPYMHESDENSRAFQHNSIKPYYMVFDVDEEDYTKCGKQYLNDNVFFGWWEERNSTSPDNYPYYVAYCSAFISLGYNCRGNTFDRGCYHINIGEDCHHNHIRLAADIEMGNRCGQNTVLYGNFVKMGHFCEANMVESSFTTLGSSCSYNILTGGNLILLDNVCNIQSDEYNKIYKGSYTVV